MAPAVRSPWGVRAALLIPVAAVLGVLAWAVVHHQRSLEIGEALARGDTPLVPAVTLVDFDGRSVSLSDLRGHPVIVNFWASWCVPCREEAPLLEGIWTEYRAKGVIVLGIDTQDLASPARRFLTQFGITYRNLRDPDGDVGRLFGTTGVPETFFVGADGRIRGRFPGEQRGPSVWREAVEGLIAGRVIVP